MKEDRDFNFNEIETFELVQKYEELIRQKRNFFFDVIEFETIINYYLDNEELINAADTIRTAIGMHPFSSEIQLLQAELSVTQKKYDEALKILEYLEKINSDNSEVLDSQDFYEVMQRYRHSPISEQHNVIKAFNEVKQFIRDNYH